MNKMGNAEIAWYEWHRPEYDSKTSDIGIIEREIESTRSLNFIDIGISTPNSDFRKYPSNYQRGQR